MEISRVIEIRSDQTLEHLHQAIFDAYDRWDEHLYEFQFGKRPFDPGGPNFGLTDPSATKKEHGDARTTKLDDLGLKPRASAHFLVDGKDFTESGRNPEKGFDLRRRYDMAAGKSGKHCASRAVPEPPQDPRFFLARRSHTFEVL